MRLFVLWVLVFAAAPVLAQNPDGGKPLEISADESLEWHRNDLYFLARKNVRATQGETELRSALLKAKYREGAGGGVDIHTIQADGDVRVLSAQSKVFGDRAVYDVDQGYAIMTGKALKLVSPDQTVTAREKFEYWTADGRLEAHGDAKAVREGDTIESDKMIAVFEEDKKTGKRVLKSLEALGHVVITTPDEILTGNRAVYSARTNVAELMEGVVIVRGPNKLQGSRAEVNLNTNVSKIFSGDQDTGGRVRAVFYPESQ